MRCYNFYLPNSWIINTNLVLISLMLFSNCSNSRKANHSADKKPNVLLIAIDDLRPELHCYGSDHIKSPNIDALANDAILFTRAYTQQAVCAPSRNTLMTGIRPDGLGIYDLGTFFRKNNPDVITLSQHFINHGYIAEGMGKIYHTAHGNKNDTLSWSNAHWSPGSIVSMRESIQSGDTTRLHTCYPHIDGKRLPWYRSNMPEKDHDDALVASHAIERLNALKDTSFFLAVGFVKPHLPFVAPNKYWEMYDSQNIVIPSKEKPKGSPEHAFTNWGELRKYYDIPAKGPLSDQDARNMIQGYYACVSFIDAQIGRLINELKNLGLYENTIIVLWGDHGWKLGEYGDWCKHTNFELDTRIPVIVRAPQMLYRGKSQAIIETVDIYPTLCELATLNLPEHLQGTSFVPVLNEPEKVWNDVAFSQYPRITSINGIKTNLMGYSMRTNAYRFTKWVNRDNGEEVFIELYDHQSTNFEMENLAMKKENADLVKELSLQFEREYNKEH